MKLPSEGPSNVIWASPGILAVCNEKDATSVVRMFDLPNEAGGGRAAAEVVQADCVCTVCPGVCVCVL